MLFLKKASWMDLVAGLSLAGLLLPEAVAYSTIAGLPPQAGVLALFAGLICYGLIGTSRFAMVSATSSSAAVLAVASASLGGADLALKLAVATALVIATGGFFLIAGLCRVGSVSDFIAKPVLRGFAFGLAILIILKQIASIVGTHPVHHDVLRFIGELYAHRAVWNWAAVGVALAALALLFACARIPRLPGGIVVIVLGILAEKTLHLANYGIGAVGPIVLVLAPPGLPRISYAEWLRVGELSVAMVLILYSESYGSIRSFAMKHGDVVRPNRDLVALGMANLVCGLFHAMPVGAGYSATSANEAAGATSRFAGLTAALVLLCIVLTAMPLIALTPQPVLAAIVIHAVSHTLRPAVFRPYFAWRRDRFVIVVSVLAVLVLGILDGLLAAIAVSLMMLLRTLSESSITVLGRLGSGHDFVSMTAHPRAAVVPGMIILRPETTLFFANADRILTQARHLVAASESGARTVILSLEESPDLDGSAIESLNDFCQALIAQGKTLFIARLKMPAYEALSRAALPGLTPDRLSDLSVDDVVRAATAPG
ncbi:MAG: SulP family inorganic anion transporter [Herminiimonas sp.]|nr:SulP family inorganic anion transporter [Herminiimonas sp.]